jgi:hypothetical protein
MISLLKRWAPTLIMMAAIFGFSSIPSEDMPSFGGFDFSIKKLGHALGYAMLALTYHRGLRSSDREGLAGDGNIDSSTGNTLTAFVNKHPSVIAWILAILYSATDEFHQSFVPGRNPSLWDIFLFDNGGAILGLWISNLIRKKTKY